MPPCFLSSPDIGLPAISGMKGSFNRTTDRITPFSWTKGNKKQGLDRKGYGFLDEGRLILRAVPGKVWFPGQRSRSPAWVYCFQDNAVRVTSNGNFVKTMRWYGADHADAA